LGTNQCRKYKLGLIKTLIIRVLRICSAPQLIAEETERLRATLQMNGYPPHIIRRGIREGQIVANRSQQQQPPMTIPKKTVFFSLAYYGHETVILASKIRKVCQRMLPHVNLHIAFKKQNSLKQIFLPLQRGIDETKKTKNVVYKIPCKDCNLVYVGETSRDRNTRMKEHAADIRKNKATSDIAKHMNSFHHSADFTHVETLGNESKWRRRVIKESLLTQQQLGKTINQVKHGIQVFQ
jgi:predicted GIY-YIG superfamily endonuclease